MFKKIFSYQEDPEVREKLMLRTTKFTVIGGMIVAAIMLLVSIFQ